MILLATPLCNYGRGFCLIDIGTEGLCRKHNISAGTFYQWKAKFGGLDVNDAKKLRHLEQENAKLKRVVADLTLDNVVLKDLLSKNW